MIPLSTLYDECIDRRKFTEQKKNPFEYIVPPPSRGSEQQVENEETLVKAEAVFVKPI